MHGDVLMEVAVRQTPYSTINYHNGLDLSFLDEFQAVLIPQKTHIRAYTRLLVATLDDIRRTATACGQWPRVAAQIRDHPIRAFLHQDPLTRRAYQKPRGYAGDAVLLDYIYQETLPEKMSTLGRILFEHLVTDYDYMRAMRHRRDRIAQIIDAEADHKPNLRILAVGCGHLREAELSYAFHARKIARYVALDHDDRCLAAVQRRVKFSGLQTAHVSIANLARGNVLAGNNHQFDLIYALNLYDYVSQGLGQRLTRRLFDLLAPGGKLVVANVLPNIHEEAYMQTFMDWYLISRELDELHDLAAALPVDLVASQRIEPDPYRVFAFLKVGKVGEA